ncbi:MAG: hypothetical protein U0792_02460 [Gemmataceae bacterium]
MLLLDIDSANLADALADARRLVSFLQHRYGTEDASLVQRIEGVSTSRSNWAHAPPPAVGYNAVCRTLAETLAAEAGVRIDRGVYDVNRLVRLPNTQHPKTGLFKRRIDAEALFRLDIDGICRHAAHPAGDGIPSVRTVSEQLAHDWTEAATATARTTETRTAARRDFAPDARAAALLPRSASLRRS